MSILNNIVFGAISVLAVCGTDYAMAMKKHTGQSYSLRDHVELRITDSIARVWGVSLASALPRPPTGWQMRKGTSADGFLVTGLPLDPAEVALADEMEAKLLAALPGAQMENRLYQNGDTAIYLGLAFLPADVKATRAAKVMTLMFSMFDSKATVPLNPDAGDFAMRKLAGPDMGKAALYYASIEGQVFISALSNAGEDETLSFMAGIDRGHLRLLIIEDPTLGKALAADGEPEVTETCVQKGAAKFCAASN